MGVAFTGADVKGASYTKTITATHNDSDSDEGAKKSKTI